MHFYSHNIGDFAAVTSGLDFEEVGIFVRLLDRYVSTEKPIKTQWVNLGFKNGAKDKAMAILEGLFEETDDGFIYEPAQKWIADYQKNAEKNRENGKKGGRPKKNGTTENPEKPTGLISLTQNNPLERQPITNNQEPITNNQEINTNKHLSLNRVEDDFLDDEPISEVEPEPVSNGNPIDVYDVFQKFGQNPVKAPDRWDDDGQCFDAPLGQLIDDSNLRNNQEALQNDNHVLTASQIIVLAKTLGTNLGHSARLDDIANRKTLTVGMVKKAVQDWKATRTSTGYLIGYLDNVSANPSQLNGKRKDREITAETISNGQCYAFAKKLGNYHPFASNNAHSGESMDAFIERVSERLKDPDYFEYCRPYLVRCGAIKEATT